jgi:pimeloyl-ACP methyl ester carboxylesterase
VFSFAAERKHPPIGKFIECDGVRLHYLERGDPTGPSVVLFHGNGSLIQDLILSGLVDRLAGHNRVLCFDRPGFGYSQRPRARIWTATSQGALFVKALNQLGVRDPVVLGHSWGTLVALAIGLQDTYPVRGLVLASGYYFPTPRWDFWMMSGPAVPVLGDLMRYTIAPVISWAIQPVALRTLFAPRSIPGLQGSLSSLPDASAEAAEGSRGGKCVSNSRSGTTAVSLSKHSVSLLYFPWHRGPAYRTRTGPTSTPSAQPC